MQFQADILRCEVLRPKVLETTAMGAAFLAGLAVGYWPDLDALKNLWQTEHVFEPEMDQNQVDSLLVHWTRAIQRSMNWETDNGATL